MPAYLQKQIYKDNIRSLISNSKSMELCSKEYIPKLFLNLWENKDITRQTIGVHNHQASSAEDPSKLLLMGEEEIHCQSEPYRKKQML